MNFANIVSRSFDEFAHLVGPFGRPMLKPKLKAAYDLSSPWLSGVNCCFSNIWNDPHWYGVTKSELVPRLLQNAHLYELISRSEVLPVQHFLIQGFSLSISFEFKYPR